MPGYLGCDNKFQNDFSKQKQYDIMGFVNIFSFIQKKTGLKNVYLLVTET